jgi:hypothetical protein
MKHNLPSVSQMCAEGHTLLFDSKKCEIRKEGSGKLVEKMIRTPNIIYILKEIGKERCCLGKENESWIWHRRMGHMNFDSLVKMSRKEAVREMPEISKPTNTMCKNCLHGKQTRIEFRTKEKCVEDQRRKPKFKRPGSRRRNKGRSSRRTRSRERRNIRQSTRFPDTCQNTQPLGSEESSTRTNYWR